MRRLFVLLAASVVAVLPWAASAQTLTIANEGGLGFRLTNLVAPIGIAVRTDIPDVQPRYVDIAATSPIVGRSELTLAIPAGAHAFLAAGAIATGWVDAGTEAHEAFGVVTCKPYLGGRPECQIKICDDLSPCAVFQSFTVAYYREVLGVVAAGWRAPGGLSVSIGARPFVGHYTERFVTTGARPEFNWNDGLDARFVGILGVSELDVPLGERGHLLLSAGAGGYRFTGETTYFGIDLAGQGIRAQLASGVSMDVGQRFALGLMGRVDYWSAWPGITTPIAEAVTCYVKENGDPVCEPPRLTGQYGATVEAAWNASIALRLSMELGR